MLYLLLKSPQLGACSQPPSTSCPSPPLISAMQTAQQHARGSGARLALSLLTASRATPSRHAPGAVAEQEVLLDPLQRLAGIGELVAALRSLRFCSASAFSCFFSHLATWQPRPGPPPAPLPNRAAVLHGHSFVQRGGTCQPAPPRRPPAPQGRFSAPSLWRCGPFLEQRAIAPLRPYRSPYRGLWAISHVLVHSAPPPERGAKGAAGTACV